MVDTSKVTERIQARSLAESPQVRRHRAVIQSVSGDGTVSVTLDGGTTTISGIRRLSGEGFNIGDTVEVVGDDTDLLIIGKVHSGHAGRGTGIESIVGVDYPALLLSGTAQHIRMHHPDITTHHWQFEFLSDGNFYIKRYDGAYNSFMEWWSDRIVFRQNLNLFGNVGYIEPVTDGFGIYGPGKFGYIEFLRIGTHDRVNINANDSVYIGTDGVHSTKVNIGGGTGEIRLHTNVQILGAGTELVWVEGTTPGYDIRAVNATWKSWGSGTSARHEARNAADSAFEKIYASAFTVQSDPRTKKDIKKVQEKVLSKLRSVHPIKFRWAHKENGRELLGFDGTELEPLGLTEGDEDSGIMVPLMDLIAFDWKATQELAEEVDQLKEENQQLRDRLDSMEQRLSALESA